MLSNGLTDQVAILTAGRLAGGLAASPRFANCSTINPHAIRIDCGPRWWISPRCLLPWDNVPRHRPAMRMA